MKKLIWTAVVSAADLEMGRTEHYANQALREAVAPAIAILRRLG